MPALLRSIRILGALALLAAPAVAQPPTAPRLERADLEAWLDGLVPEALRKADIAGLVVSVVKNGTVLFQKGYGLADIAAKTPMDPERSLVKAASISKSFTSTAVMQLVEQGKLDLDRDVNGYLDFAIPAAFGKPITLRHLLTHSAGFEETSYKRYVPPAPLRQHMLMVPDRIYPPGEVPAYSNYGVNLAGYIVERVSGEPIALYVERHILAPLGMTHSTFRVTVPAALQPFEAKNYPLASSGEPFPPNLIPELSPVDAPASGLSTTAQDMTRFMLAHLQQGRLGDYQLLRPETVQLMHAPAFVPIPGAQPLALGLFRTDYRGHVVIGHSGDGEGVHAEMKLLPDDSLGVFTAVNSDGSNENLLPAAFTLRTELFEQFMDRYFPAPATAEEPAAATAAEHSRIVAGEYVWSRQPKGDFQEALFLVGRYLGLKLVIRANPDGTIETSPMLTFHTNGKPQTWRETGPFVWREVGGEAHLVMKVANDRVESVWSDGAASVWVNLRVPFVWSAGLNVPLLGSAAVALLFTVLGWPVAALLRRRGQPVPLAADERRARLWTRVAVVLGVLYLFGWATVMSADLASRVGAEPWIRLVQLMGLGCIAGAGIAGWNAWLTWRGRRGLFAKVGSLVPALGLLYLVWFSFAFHLISLRLG